MQFIGLLNPSGKLSNPRLTYDQVISCRISESKSRGKMLLFEPNSFEKLSQTLFDRVEQAEFPPSRYGAHILRQRK